MYVVPVKSIQLQRYPWGRLEEHRGKFLVPGSTKVFVVFHFNKSVRVCTFNMTERVKIYRLSSVGELTVSF